MAEIYPFGKLFLPTTFNSAIRQTLTCQVHIPAVQLIVAHFHDDNNYANILPLKYVCYVHTYIVVMKNFAYMIVSAHKAEYGISGFGVSNTTMEEVFIKIGEGLNEALEGRLINISILLCLSCI